MRRKIPASNTLLCFDAATSHRSLTRAAVELALTQSAASRQIHALVKYLGVALFERTHHGMELTPVGVDYGARLAQRLGDFARRHPGVTVHFETRTRPFLFSDTALDAAIYAATPEQLQRWAGTHSQLLEEEDVVVICQPSLLGRRKYIKAETLSAWRYSSKAPVQTPGASGLPRLVCRPRGRCPVRVTSSFP